MKIQKTTSSENVARYNSTAPQILDGQWVVVTAYGRSCDDQGMYTHSMDVRHATDAEILAAQITDAQDRLIRSSGDAVIEDELRALQGRPSLAEVAAMAATEASAQSPSIVAAAVDAMSVAKDAVGIDDDGDEYLARDWDAVKRGLTARGQKNLSTDGVCLMSDDEIVAILVG